jgi:plasmid stability protein
MARKPTELRPIMTRLPEDLRQRLEREAEDVGRSMNAEIIHRLEQSFEKSDRQKMIEETATATATYVVSQLTAKDPKSGKMKTYLVKPRKGGR